jgi:glycosyltransferase involved in cell wall biosynthesis
MSNILRQLEATGNYDIDVIGINYAGGPYDTEKFPGRVWPAISALRMQGPYADYHGKQVFLDQLQSQDYDIVFIVQDTFIVLPITSHILEIQRNKENPFATIFYYPFDCAPKEEWVKQCVYSFDFPVAYTEYAKEESRKYLGPLADKIDVIYHGTNIQDFFPIETPEIRQQIRQAFFGEFADKFIITNLNRNQGRKDISRSFMILKELKNRGVEDAFLYMHMQETDFGGSLIQMARNFDLEPGKDWTLPNPQQFSAHQGYPVQAVNNLYNASDVYLTTTHGEGWGLSITEAMATKLPVVAPANTSINEILGDNERGWKIPSGHTPSHWIIKDNDNERMRPLMDVELAADAIMEIKSGKNLERAEAGYEWAKELTWENLTKSWLNIFNKATNKVKSAKLLKNNQL